MIAVPHPVTAPRAARTVVGGGILALAALAAMIVAPRAQAAGTSYWTLRTAADFAQAELAGVAVGPDGLLSPGPRIDATELPAETVVWGMLAEDDVTILATTPGGRILTVRGSDVRGDSTGDGAALCVTRGPDGALYAGTGPNGRVVRLDRAGRRTWFETGQKYVWALVWAGRTLYAATGPLGRVYAIDGEGKGRVVLDAKVAHLSAMIPDGKGGVFVGASGRGMVYHLPSNGKPRALFEAAEKEIRALAWDGRALFVAALSAAPVTFGTNDAPEPGDGTGQRAVVYRIVPDSSSATHWVAPQGLVFGLAPAPDGDALWAATGSRAALYRIDGRGRGTTLWNEPAGQATALARIGGAFRVATSGPARLLTVRPADGGGTVASPVLDAKRIARWGRLWSEGAGTPRLRTRSGNTAEPDTTWSSWQEPREGGAVASPAARYLQWEAKLDGADRVRAVTVAWGEENQRPRIEEFVVYPLPGKFYEGELNVRRDPVTQELPDGRKVQFNADIPRRGASEALPPWAQGVRPMSWKASDPNGDNLVYRLAVRQRGTTAWTPLAVGLSNTLYAWDTTGFPDGTYDVQLTAGDLDENAVGRGLEDELVVESVELDRRPPGIEALDARVAGDVITVTGRARDERGFIARAQVALDDGGWFTAAPDDGLWDGSVESFTLRLEGVPAGEHLVRVRFVDSLGNPVLDTRTVRVGR